MARKTRQFSWKGEEGVALIAALTMMMLFALMGAAYVGYMSTEFDRTQYEIRNIHAKQLAAAGIRAAIGTVQQALENGDTPGSEYTFAIPVYDQQLEADLQQVRVHISDEAARINLNLAPREVLEAIGFDRSQVRDLKRDLPRPDAAQGRWLTSLNDLRARGVVGPETFTRLNPSDVTFVSADPSSPQAYLNLNSASPAVLAAVLNLTIEDAEALAAQRPFTDWADVVSKSGKSAETFNIRPGPDGGMPDALALRSLCYRIESAAALPVYRAGSRAIRYRIEAVIALKPNGNYSVRHWQEGPGEAAQAPETELQEAENTGNAEASPEVDASAE